MWKVRWHSDQRVLTARETASNAKGVILHALQLGGVVVLLYCSCFMQWKPG